ncbi:MAG TPA: hypothetical protein VLH18_05845, partial [Candidatus Limnocylindrales bacterium]|nr:hypothetical protein [Candidatus Limnocylindrales bacterium]
DSLLMQKGITAFETKLYNIDNIFRFVQAGSEELKDIIAGLKVVYALIPVGRGQRELILGDRQIGKTAIALDTIINQAGKDVLCVYCSIGQQGAAAAKFIAQLRKYGAMAYSTVVVASGDGPPGLRYIAPCLPRSVRLPRLFNCCSKELNGGAVKRGWRG